MQSASPLQGLEPLVAAMAAGDQAALSSIYRQTAGHLFAIAGAMLRSREDAEEVVCDAYIDAWQHAHTFDASRGSVIAWLAVIARNRAVDRLRQRRPVLSLDDERNDGLVESVMSEAPGPEQVLAQSQSDSAVRRALKSLSPQRRRLLGLAFFHGLSHQEIADVVGLPLGTVKSHVRRALAALRAEEIR